MPRLWAKAQIVEDLIDAAHVEIALNESDSDSHVSLPPGNSLDSILHEMGISDSSRDSSTSGTDSSFTSQDANDSASGDSSDEPLPVLINSMSDKIGSSSSLSGDGDLERSYGDQKLGLCAQALVKVLSKRYMVPRPRKPKLVSLLQTILCDWKYNDTPAFRRAIRMNPDAFDALVNCLSHCNGFYNHSNYSQTAVAMQVAIALHRFGSFGNAAGVIHIADKLGVSPGLVEIVGLLSHYEDKSSREAKLKI